MDGYFGTLRYRLMLWAALLLIPSPSRPQAPSASDFVGIWQGSLPLDQTQRVVVKISSAGQSSLRGVFTWVDRDSNPIAFSAVSSNGKEFSAASDLLDLAFRGRVTEDGLSIAGVWTQGKHDYAITLAKISPGSEWKHNDALALLPMSSKADPAFEVATVKPSANSSTGHRYEWRTRQFRAYDVTVADLIKFAFQLRDRQMKGAPDWVTEAKFDVAGEPDAPGLPTEQQYHAMMRKLLVERFGLQFHMDQLSFSVYALTRADHDVNLAKSDPSFGLDGHVSVKQESEGDTVIRFDSESMPELLGILMNFIEDRQLVDETGLTGRYSFAITVPTTALQSSDAGEKASAFLRGVRPLGLELVRKKADLPVMTFDNINRPSQN